MFTVNLIKMSLLGGFPKEITISNQIRMPRMEKEKNINSQEPFNKWLNKK